MSLPTEPTDDVPLSAAEIAGFMNWRGPGAYSIHAERRIRKLVAEAVRRERETNAMMCDDMALYTGVDCAAAIRARGGK